MRPPEPADLILMSLYLGGPNLLPPPPLQDTRLRARRGDHEFTVSLAGLPIGSVRLAWRSGGRYELDYMLFFPFWGTGLVAEIVRAMLEFAREDLGAREVHAHVHPLNEIAGSAPRRLGFTRRTSSGAPRRNCRRNPYVVRFDGYGAADDPSRN